MRAHTERQHLYCDHLAVICFDKSTQLTPHDIFTTDLTPQDSLVKNDDQLWGRVPRQHRLPRHPNSDPLAVDLLILVNTIGGYDRAGVLSGLQQARNDLCFVVVDAGGFGFEPDVGLIGVR